MSRGPRCSILTSIRFGAEPRSMLLSRFSSHTPVKSGCDCPGIIRSRFCVSPAVILKLTCYPSSKIAAIQTQACYLALLGADRPMINRLPLRKSTTFWGPGGCHSDPAVTGEESRSALGEWKSTWTMAVGERKDQSKIPRCPSAAAHASTSLSVPEQRRREGREQSRTDARNDKGRAGLCG